MEYTINTLAKLAGVSTRTLRYYDEIDLLKPKRIGTGNYRIYGQNEVNLLQQILFFKELDLPLDVIKSILTRNDFNSLHALKSHKEHLLEKQRQVELLLNNVNQTIASIEGGINMKDQAKFEGFKKEMLHKNEESYGKEIREKYGDTVVDESNHRIMGLRVEEYQEAEAIAVKITDKLVEAMQVGETDSELAKEVVALHKKWLSFYGNYTPQAHVGLGQMYVDDPRFTKYYEDRAGFGAATFLCNAIGAYYHATFDETTHQWRL